MAFEDGKIMIWMGAGKGDANLQAVADKFTAELGIEVVVEVVDPGLTDKYQQAAARTSCFGPMTGLANGPLAG